jgi:glycosyltransferase involved in cell wall biosynthesis
MAVAEGLPVNLPPGSTPGPAAMISFVVPAHNEELWIGKCLTSIRTSMEPLARPYEVIVVDDASTDTTPRIAGQMGARTLRVEHRKISAARNAGAREASGDVLFFVDADTQINERVVRAALTVLRAGAAGGGCVFDFDGPTPLWARIIVFFAVLAARVIRWVGGCFLFCTREAYSATGGFSESLYAGEDIAFVQALKKVGRFVVLKPKVVSSGRKLTVVRPWEVVGLMSRIALRGARYESEWVLDILYGRRSQECRKPVKPA